jgi:hypothetical protein
MTLTFLKLRLTTQAIAVGERIKKGTFRPCIETLPTSTLMGCFYQYFELQDNVVIGFFERDTYQKAIFTYAPFDASLGTAKLPLSLEYLAPKEGLQEIAGEVYIEATNATRSIFTKNGGTHQVVMGALRSKGFGHCKLSFEKEIQPERKVGYLRGNLRISDLAAFGITPRKDVILERYGYLFRPDAYHVSGKYEKALFTGTILEGPDFLIEGEYRYDR